jgi:hypothetical protein
MPANWAREQLLAGTECLFYQEGKGSSTFQPLEAAFRPVERWVAYVLE